MSNQINDFSLLCRLFGNLFYRSPQDPVLTGVLQWLEQQRLSQVWALVEDDQISVALKQLQQKQDLAVLVEDYQTLNQAVSFRISDYAISVEQFVAFRQERGIPDVAQADQVGLLLLTASWLEDNSGSLQAQQQLFEQYLLPTMAKFLGKIEAHATTVFYRALARLTRVALASMADELEENALALQE
ncbi:hypothetical protein CEP49_02235 [Mergibacter septicus]|uniref:TorD/DmsD family molecular chaperone n=1 Tax=Mergibacter septicus TaxID=221402 RepID=UPI001178F9E0|nr:molecular chaperone [Mergibacter septicus]AWX13451.1 hypothetical protein CEP49_02235 [Mergibacter septicus]